MSLVQHSSITNEHPTPLIVCELVWELFRGAPSLDPASRRKWNNAGMQAESYYSLPKEDALLSGDLGGLSRPWHGKVAVNPPGGALTPIKEPRVVKSGKSKGMVIPADSPGMAAYKLAAREQWETNSHAVAWWRKAIHEVAEGHADEVVFIAFSIEILQSAQRKGWISPLRFPLCIPEKRLKFGGDQPTHANAIIYVGPHEDRFCRVFSTLGEVRA